MYKNVYLSFIYNSVIVETNNMPNNEWLVKKIMIYPHIGIVWLKYLWGIGITRTS